jgi:glycosyltransferase involved in cell wall biosynthesis
MSRNKVTVGIITNTAQFVGGVEQVNRMMVSMLNRNEIDSKVISLEMLNLHGILGGLRQRLYGKPRLVSDYFNKYYSDKVDVAICNGEYANGIQHDHAMVVFHGCYYGYANGLKNYSTTRVYNRLMCLAKEQKAGTMGKYVVAVSAELARILGEQGIKVDKVINNSVDTDLFRPSPSDKKLDRCLFVGSHDYYGKGFDILGQIADLGIAVDCISKDRPSHPKLGWLSSISNENLPAYYSKYKFLLFPSRFEGSGLVVAEAMACGTPVIMSNVGLGPELKREIPPFVVEEPWENMAQAMIGRMAVIEANYSTYSQKARAYVIKHHNYYDWEKNWLEVIRFVKRGQGNNQFVANTLG